MSAVRRFPVHLEAAPRADARDIADQFTVDDEERRRVAETIYVLLLAQARNKAITGEDLDRLEAAGVDASRLDDLAEQIARARSAELAGMRWTPDGELVRDPSAEADIFRTTEDAVNKAVTKAADAPEDEPVNLAVLVAGLAVFGASRVDGILDYEMSDAVSAMQLLAWEAAGVGEVEVHDAWDPSLEHCDECIAIDGEVWTIAQAMENRKEHPHCCREFIAKWPAALREAASARRPDHG
jgi:hypothetical protein